MALFDSLLSRIDPFRSSRRTGAAQALEIKSYTTESPSGALDPASFDGLGGDSGAFPLGDGSGNGWEIGGGSNAGRLAERYFGGESTLAAGTVRLPLGNGYNELTMAEDLAFTWANSDGYTFDARVEYVGEAPSILLGDYNNNAVVDAADYVVWRDNLDSATSLANDDTPGVGPDDYDRWKLHFGEVNGANGSGSVSALPSAEPLSAAVPEPSTLVLLMFAAAGSCLRREGAVAGRRRARNRRTSDPVTAIIFWPRGRQTVKTGGSA